MNSLPKRRLGRGLAALIGDDVADEPAMADTRNHAADPDRTGSPQSE